MNRRSTQPTAQENKLFDICYDFTGRCPLQYVNRIIQFILRRRSPRRFDINAKNDRGETALAFCLERIYIHHRLLFDTTAGDQDYYSPEGLEYYLGIGNRKFQLISLLINNGANVHIRIPCTMGHITSMLHIACNRYNPINIVQLLLDKGISANDMDNWNQTPLHRASRCGNLEMMSLLLSNGADPNARDRENNSPITFLIDNFKFGICFGKRGNTNRYKIEKCFDLLLRYGANVNDIGVFGASSLFMAIVGNGRLPFITKIIEAGADVNVGFNNQQEWYLPIFSHMYFSGDTPLHAAARCGDIDILKFVLLYNPDINCVNYRGQTAFDYPYYMKRKEVRDEISLYKRRKIFEYLMQQWSSNT